MWFARYFPGLPTMLEHVSRLTPEETAEVSKAGREFLKHEGDERVAHTKAIATAAGMRMR
jgi:hypothetical protein